MKVAYKNFFCGQETLGSTVSSIISDRCWHLEVAASRLLPSPAWLKLKGVAGHWLVQHTAPIRDRPDGRPRLEGACYKYPTSCSFPTYPSSTLHVTHTLAHTYQFLSFPWASSLGHYKVSALRSRLGWTPCLQWRTNERAFVGIVVCCWLDFAGNGSEVRSQQAFKVAIEHWNLSSRLVLFKLYMI